MLSMVDKIMVKTSEQALIIFVKNPVLGKVKTRLARDIGDVAALAIYHRLLAHTAKESRLLLGRVDIFLYFSDSLPPLLAGFPPQDFRYRQQVGADLGQRMANAFADIFSAGYAQAVIIGSDCFELQTSHLQAAFVEIADAKNDFVIGAALDGGYYLLAMRQLFAPIFVDKTWSSPTVLADTVADILAQKLTIAYLPTLRDVDTVADLPTGW